MTVSAHSAKDLVNRRDSNRFAVPPVFFDGSGMAPRELFPPLSMAGDMPPPQRPSES